MSPDPDGGRHNFALLSGGLITPALAIPDFCKTKIKKK